MNELTAWSYERLHRADERTREHDPGLRHRRDARRRRRLPRSGR